MDVHPLFRWGSLKILPDVNEVIVLDSEIIQGGDIDMVQFPRRNRLGFEPFAHPRFQASRGNHVHHDFLPRIDLFRLVGQRAVGDFSDCLQFLRGDAVFAQKDLAVHVLRWGPNKPHY